MCVAVLFLIDNIWKQPKCLLTEKCINKRWYIYTTEYYSAIKNSEIMSFAATWMVMEIIIVSEVCQKENNKHAES